MYQAFEHFQLPIGQGIALVAPETVHAKPLFDLIQEQRSYLSNWISWIHTTQSVEDVRQFIRESRAFNEGGQRLTAFVRYHEQIVGSVGFVQLNMRHKKGELGYWLSQKLQGKGIVTLSCFKLIDFAFQQLYLNRIEIRILLNNKRSRGVPLRLGFQHEGRLRQAIWLNDQYHDMDIYSMLAPQWEEQKAGLGIGV